MAKEQKTAETTEKQTEKVSETAENNQKPAGSKAAYKTEYPVQELSDAAASLFGTKPVIVRAALKAGGKEKYTEEEAVKIVKAFMQKEVK